MSRLQSQRQAPAVPRRRGSRVLFRNEGIGLNRLNQMRVPTEFSCGMELELFFPQNNDATTIINALNSRNVQQWRVKHDSSIQCSPNMSSCYKAELVSPVMKGEDGIRQIFVTMDAVKHLNPTVNKSTGLHVHLRPDTRSGWTLQQLKTLSYNFVQLESALDLLMPHSRRSNNNHYCKSNLNAMISSGSSTKRQALAAIEAAGSIEELKQLVCPEDRYYKLNLRALERHGTVEFRHAGGSQNAAKAAAFMLLWLCLAQASLQGSKAATPAKGYAFENLMSFMSFNPVLLHWLPRRKLERNPKRAATEARGAHGAGCACAACQH